jgi:hypothetical protein
VIIVFIFVLHRSSMRIKPIVGALVKYHSRIVAIAAGYSIKVVRDMVSSAAMDAAAALHLIAAHRHCPTDRLR